jgi:hypothetical protein
MYTLALAGRGAGGVQIPISNPNNGFDMAFFKQKHNKTLSRALSCWGFLNRRLRECVICNER